MTFLRIGVLSFVILAGRSLATADAASDVREWSDRTGNYRIEAALLKVDGANVQLRKRDGTVVAVPLDRLSDGDRKFVLQNSEQPSTGVRTWVDSTGDFQMQAELIAATPAEVRLRKQDGGEITVPVDRLCPRDRTFALQHAKDTADESGTFAAGAGGATAAPAADERAAAAVGRSDDADPMDPLELEVEQLTEQFKGDFQAFLLKLRMAPRQQQQQIAKRDDPRVAFSRKFYELADSKRRTRCALQALVKAAELSVGDSTGARNWMKKSTDRLLEDHLESKGLATVCMRLAQSPLPATSDFLRQVIEKSPHEDCKGVACFALAYALHAKDANGAQREEILALLERAAKEYGHVRCERGLLKDVAGPLITEIKYLSVGSTAQQIVGVDIEGQTFKLSDFKGKVVVLDFFADWCPFCKRMYPHERELVEKYRDQPFVLLGINTDPPQKLKQLIDQGEVKWRVWVDGLDKQISKEWRVSSIPTMFVLDGEGVIRHKFLGDPGPKLEAAIQSTVAEHAAVAAKLQ